MDMAEQSLSLMAREMAPCQLAPVFSCLPVPQTPLPCPLAPFLLPSPSVLFVQLWPSSCPSLSGISSHISCPHSGWTTYHALGSCRRAASSVPAEGAAADDAQESVSVHPFPGCCLLLHLPAQLLFSDSPSCPRGVVFQNPITASSRKSLNLSDTELVLLFPTPHWGLF